MARLTTSLTKKTRILIIMAALLSQSYAWAKDHGEISPGSSENSNTGPGNQGNDKTVGNAGGGSNNENPNPNPGGDGHHGEGNNGNGVGNTSLGNQGNDKPVGNAGGDQGGTPDTGTGTPGTPDTGTGSPSTPDTGTGSPSTPDTGTGSSSTPDTGSGTPDAGNEGSGTQGSGGSGSGQNTRPESTASKKGQFQFKLVPLIFGDFDAYTRIYNLSESQGIIELDDDSNGFKVVKQYDYNIGLGIAGILTNTAAAGVGISIGVAPYAGAKVVFTNFAQDLEGLKSIKRKIPFKATDVSHLATGESVLFDQKGGLFIGAGISAYGVGISGKVIIEGSFKTRVEKLDENKVLASVFVDKVRAASLATNVAIAALTATRVAEISEGFNYIIDLSDEAGAEAYEEMMAGDLTKVEQAADLTPLRSVKRTDTVKSKKSGSSKRFSLGIPFMGLSSGEGLFIEHSYRVNHVESIHTDMDYGIFQKSKSTRFITRHKSVSQVFVGGTAVTKDKEKNFLAKDSQGKFEWKYEDDHGSSAKFGKYLKALRARTGLEDFLNVLIQDKQKLGYTEINFSVTYPDLYVRFLLEQANNDQFLNEVQVNAHQLMVDYFKDQLDQDRICAWNVGSDSLSMIGTRICVKTFSRQIATKTAQLNKLFADTKATQRDSRKFARNMAKIGELVWSNPFLFKTLVQEGRKCGLAANLEISGKRISTLKRILIARADSSCHVK